MITAIIMRTCFANVVLLITLVPAVSIPTDAKFYRKRCTFKFLIERSNIIE